MIVDIDCSCMEYRLCNGKWKRTFVQSYPCDSGFIENMVNSSPYYQNLGGYMSTEWGKNRRFGLVASKVVCVSICGTVKRVFTFSYNRARLVC